MPSAKGIDAAWKVVGAGCPGEWASWASRTPREVDPKIHGDSGVAGAKGPHAGERVQG
jgi:hypothetical protein